MTELKRTPLYPVHLKHLGKLVDFSGWELSVVFAGIKEEHLAVRERAGIFDVSHMGEVWVRGAGALAYLQYATANDVSGIAVGGSQYSSILNREGGIIDDIFIYRLGETEYLICVNAGNQDLDFAHLAGLDHPDCEATNESAAWAQIALQGPLAVGIGARAMGQDPAAIAKMRIAKARVAGVEVLAARTGYTGEDGFEFFVPAAEAVKVWERIMEVGSPEGLVPCGLGARDTLRLEMGYPLHGHDITPMTTPLEADLARFVALNKADFMGKSALDEQLKKGFDKKRVAMVMIDPGIPRDGYRIVSPSGEGKVTSGTKTPSLDHAVAMGYVPIADAAVGTGVGVEIRGKLKKARVVALPFYRK